MRIKFPMPGYADPTHQVKWSVSNEAFAHFPEVTPEDDTNEQERYRLLLGQVHESHHLLRVHIEAVVAVVDRPDLYEEGIAQCAIDFEGCKLFAQDAITALKRPELRFVGDLHTHPKGRLQSWFPSDTDIDTWCKCYAEGWFTVNEPPFLFIIGGRVDEQQTGYAAYRVVHSENNWKVTRVPDVLDANRKLHS